MRCTNDIEYAQLYASKSFISDAEKMRDFLWLSKEEFLQSYSYITDEEYEATFKYFAWLHGIRVVWSMKGE